MPRPLNEADVTRFQHNLHFYCHLRRTCFKENHLYTMDNNDEINMALINRFKTPVLKEYAEFNLANGVWKEVEG